MQVADIQVVELLIRKLESETSFHRKVDLFFLVDSITQCSHNHKGMYACARFLPCMLKFESLCFRQFSLALLFLIVAKISGIAGSSYIPTVQSALPRLLGAAAPPGVGARENRRQCLKVGSYSFWIC